MGIEEIRSTVLDAQPMSLGRKVLPDGGRDGGQAASHPTGISGGTHKRSRRLINIDNGGTLTDFCVIEDGKVFRTKSITTPYDLSECLFQGLRQVAVQLYGREDVEALLRGTDLIRYSTTQGTNALVERKGPRLGMIVDDTEILAAIPQEASARGLYEALIGNRAVKLDTGLEDEALERAIIAAVNQLTSEGANRLVVSFSGADYIDREKRSERVILRRFPMHLLGSVPVLFSHEISDDSHAIRRTWSALFNAFLHPAMEQFLYATERRMRNYKTSAPLLIFRNDGGSARVAKTIALKTYGSGPRAGMEGVRALALHYGFDELLSVDVGGTTSDIGLVGGGAIRSRRRGSIEGVEVSFPLSEVASIGVGGSSVIRAVGGEISVGPESVGSVPGPACFGRGGKHATITDAFLLIGVFDPATFFGGRLALDPERSRSAIMETIAGPLGLSLEEAIAEMERAWAKKIADGILSFAPISAKTVLAAFGGAGAMSICTVAEHIGVGRVIVPGLASVFSAVGIGFSDLSQEYELRIRDRSRAAVASYLEELETRAARDMFAEGVDLADCAVETSLICTSEGSDTSAGFAKGGSLPPGFDSCDEATLRLRVVKALDRVPLVPVGRERSAAAISDSDRRIHLDGRWQSVPVYRLDSQQPGASAEGAAVIEGSFFTGKLLAGWRFDVSANRDLILSRA
jgi:N-methylhydantoinase A/oxoprolinase/acetone carboxylase beta subunit